MAKGIVTALEIIQIQIECGNHTAFLTMAVYIEIRVRLLFSSLLLSPVVV